MTDSVDRQAPPPREVREAAIELLTTAYGEGQLTPEEYDERVAGVLAADNSWRLERWINDLQVAPTVPTTPKTSGWAALRRDWATVPRAGKVALAAVVLVVGSVWVGTAVHEPAREDSSVVVPRGVTSGIGDFRAAYEDEFGTTTVGNVQIDPGYAHVAVPVEDDPPRFQEYAFQNGSFSETRGGVRGGRAGVVDLALIDVDAVEAALADAVAELGVTGANEVTTIIQPQGSDTGERITLVISNEFDESARLTTDFAGRELRRQPFVEPGEG